MLEQIEVWFWSSMEGGKKYPRIERRGRLKCFHNGI